MNHNRPTNAFPKGGVANPAGRPPGLRTVIEQRFGKNCSQAWDVLESIMNGRLESVQEKVLGDGRIVEIIRRPTIAERKEAAETVIAYCEGKPAQQTLNVNVNQDLSKLDQNDLAERVVGILARYAEAQLSDHQPELPDPAPQPETLRLSSGDSGPTSTPNPSQAPKAP